MGGRLVDLSQRSRSPGKANHGPGTVPSIMPHRAAAPIRPMHEWDVDIVAMLTIDPGAVPNVACVRWIVTTNTMQRGYEVSVIREGWHHSLTLRGRYQPAETAEQAQRREGVLRFLNELLAASYGVPA